MAYTKTTNFTIKDTLSSGTAAKLVKGAEIDDEFDNLQTELSGTGDVPLKTRPIYLPQIKKSQLLLQPLP